MAIDLSSLQKMETLPASLQQQDHHPHEMVAVVVHLHPGAQRPDYITVRTEISKLIFVGELLWSDLAQLDADLGVQSFSLSRPVQGPKNQTLGCP